VNHRLLRGLIFLAVMCIGILGYSSMRTVYAGGPTATPGAPCDPQKATCKFVAAAEPKSGKFNQAAVEKIDLQSYPLVPEVSAHVLAIYQEGMKKGNNIHVFSKVGDCMTATDDFMKPFTQSGYSLGEYAALEKVIKLYAKAPAGVKDSGFDSFSNPGLAATSGFNAAGVLDATWSDPKACTGDESPLACEYRVNKPGIALIMFGTNDMKSIKPEDFDLYLRRVVVQTINNGTIPILSTFPVQPGLEDASILYNKITVKVATDYDIPLINLYLALKPLEHQGVDPVNTTHMTKPADGKAGDLTKDGLQYGFNMRNLLSLQALEAVLNKIDPKLLGDSAS
jgi:hypothetical protein